MLRHSGAATFLVEDTSITQLAQLFPDASPVRIPVQVMAVRAGGEHWSENTLIEYGTPTEILFSSVLPLEFDDKLRVKNSDGSLDAEATVVAVQYHDRKKAVAARFAAEIGNWIIKR